MKIVVDIDEDLYNRIISTNHLIGFTDPMSCEIAIMHSIPLTESDDCVSREAVNILVDELARAISDERCCISRGRSTATIMQDILDLPSVQPKQDKGEWIAYHLGAKWICSQCNEKNDSRDNFCPNCGADMRGEK